MPGLQLDRHPGLSSADAAARLARDGYNEVADARPSPFLGFLGKFWAPVPWMLEATIVLTLLTGRYADAEIIAFLLVFNAGVSARQEDRAGKALELLRKRLAVKARVRRDGLWQIIPARDLVAGDLIHLRLGDVVPADVILLDGYLLLDEAALTGESVPQSRTPPETAYAGATAKGGEATGEVTATGSRTYFGKTTELVKTAKTASHLEAIVFRIVRYLVLIDLLLGVTMLGFAVIAGSPVLQTIPFLLILLVASVPVALPATFTLAQALGAQTLAAKGVLVTRLSAIEEAAGMDVLCTDKTGTITLNQMEVTGWHPYPPFTPADLWVLAAKASDPAGQDPIESAILKVKFPDPSPFTDLERLSFTPFDPQTKRTEAILRRGDQPLWVAKGAPKVLAGICPGTAADRIEKDVEALAADGYRVIGVAAGPLGQPRLAGLIALQDPLRPDSQALVAALRDLGVKTKMLTGDSTPTARAIASQVGIGGRICTSEDFRERADAMATTCDVFAGILPEDKFRLVQSLQTAGHITGMTGDGVNDAPALKQAEVGIAVATATDVAKAAASLVLTNPGLLDVVAAVQTSRRIYQRMHTYVLNKIVKTLQIAFFLSIAFFLTLRFVTTPFLIVLLLFANDFVTMSIATDRVHYSPKPDRWHIRRIVVLALILAFVLLLESFLVLYLAVGPWHLPWPQVRTAVFLMLVYSGQATVYVARESRPFWSSLPSTPLLVASGVDVLLVSILALTGVFMAPVTPTVVLAVLAVAAVFMFIQDLVKMAMSHRFGDG